MDVMAAKRSPLWWEEVPAGPTRAPLSGATDADVAIVGAGFTGLWTAFYLKRLEPALRIVVLEREHVGYGASGRNGGWCHAAYPLGLGVLVSDHGKTEGVRFERALNEAVAEVGRVAAAEGIDCHFLQGGRVLVARDELHLARAAAEVEEYRELGLGEDDIRLLDRDEASALIGADGVEGGSFSPHAAAVQPALLAHGLATACERLGVKVHESTAVAGIAQGRADTPFGTVRAEVVIRATEGYSAGFAGQRRKLVPLYSHMIATEPLPADVWDQIGLQGRATFADYSPSLIYGQRTHDGRLAFGGRGAPYHWGSAIADAFDVHDGIHRDLARVLRGFFPQLEGVEVTHRWGGPLGVSRDWRPSVSFSRRSGLGWAGGYVGDGVATSNLAGRTLADLVLDRDTELTSLGWVDHRWRNWEPEPLRFVGINAGLWLARSAADEEVRTGRASWRAELGDWLRGKRSRG